VSLDSSGRAVLVTTLPIGTHTVAADYSGSPACLASRATTSVTVQGFTTTTTLSVPRSLVKAGKPMSVSVDVASTGSSLPTGLVRLYDGVEPVASAA
jgi:hypothetical protein